MKKIKFIAMALMAMTGLMLGSCMGDICRKDGSPYLAEALQAA